MGISVGNAVVVVDRDWTEFKKVLDGTEKTLVLQSEYTAPIRTSFALDEGILYTSVIYDAGAEPSGWSAGQITANTNARNDFAANWATLANKQVSVRGTVNHYNGSATTTPASVLISPRSASILVHNTDTGGSNDLLVSFDGGVAFKTVGKGLGISFNATVGQVHLKSSAGTVSYELLVVS